MIKAEVTQEFRSFLAAVPVEQKQGSTVVTSLVVAFFVAKAKELLKEYGGAEAVAELARSMVQQHYTPIDLPLDNTIEAVLDGVVEQAVYFGVLHGVKLVAGV